MNSLRDIDYLYLPNNINLFDIFLIQTIEIKEENNKETNNKEENENNSRRNKIINLSKIDFNEDYFDYNINNNNYYYEEDEEDDKDEEYLISPVKLFQNKENYNQNVVEDDKRKLSRKLCEIPLVTIKIQNNKSSCLIQNDHFVEWKLRIDQINTLSGYILSYHQEEIRNIFHLLLENSNWSIRDQKKNIKKSKSKSKIKNQAIDLLYGGTLIVCSKQRIKEWDQIIRNYPTLKYYSYTESLSKRRKLGIARLSTFDIVLTTFDVLRAKEASIQELNVNEESNEDTKEDTKEEVIIDDIIDSDVENNQDLESNNCWNESNWYYKRKKVNNQNSGLCISNLHLLQWNSILIDHSEKYHQLRCGTLRGDSIFNLKIIEKIGKKISIIDRVNHDEYWLSKSGAILQNISQLLNISNTQLKDYYYEFK